jgi:hypothetical protein
VSAILDPSLIELFESHVMTTRPLTSSTRPACLLMSITVGRSQSFVLWMDVRAGLDSDRISARRQSALESIVGRSLITMPIANIDASASVWYLPSDVVFVFQPFCSFQAAAARKLASFATFTNSDICCGWLGDMFCGTWESLGVELTRAASVEALLQGSSKPYSGS